MEASIGILIIGSLYWDDRPNRSRRRCERLNLSTATSVYAPIRYGRCSETRGYSYTMVFSQGLALDKASLGTAIAVACKRSVQGIQDLEEEAEALWTAESNATSANGRIGAVWGCVALAVNPTHPVSEVVREGWARRVSQEQSYGHFDHATDEEGIVEQRGVLNVPWPRCTDASPLEFNALLATATRPTLVRGAYPSARQIADAWKTRDGSAHVDYFWRNRKHNITTFQDAEIESYLCDGISS